MKLGIFCLLLVAIISICNTPVKAQSRSTYMERGDNYLTQADNCMMYKGKQVFGILALAAYTAAQKE
jgi:hypothetical protein